MFTTKWELYTSQFLNTMGTVHFTIVTHSGNSTLQSGHHRMGTVHFTMVTTYGNRTLHNGYAQWELYTSQLLPHNGKCTVHNGYHTMGTVHFTIVTTQWKWYTFQWLHTMGTGVMR